MVAALFDLPHQKRFLEISSETTIGEEMLEHIWDDKTPKEAWDMFVMLFSKRRDVRTYLG